MLKAGRVLSREQLEQNLYSWGQEVESNAIEVHVHHLRRKLGSALIRTVRGVGYMFRLRFFTDATARTKNGQPAHSTTGVPSSSWTQFEVCGAMT